MATRQPAPRIDPRDPNLAGVRDFLYWLYKLAPDAFTNVTTLLTDVAALATDVADLDTRVTTLEGSSGGVVGSCVYEFTHPGHSASSATRRMWGVPFPHTTLYTTQATYAQRIIPYAGNLKLLNTINLPCTSGGSNTQTYTVLLSTDNGATFSPTALTTSTTANDVTLQSSSGTVAVNAGDLIAVEVTLSGAITNTVVSAGCWRASVWYERT